MNNQIALFDVTDAPDPRDEHGTPDILSYDYYIVGFSGGKDSIAAFLSLLDQGVPRESIELWHHCVDGKGNEAALFDWPVTEDYCRQFAKAFGVKIYFSWKEGGFEREMTRNQERTAPTWFETPEGTFRSGGTQGKLGTRRIFPQLSADLKVRWCSAYMKIDPSSKALTGQTRFSGQRTLFVTGERAQESAARSKYATFLPHRTDRRSGRLARLVDHLRAVHAWSETEVWAKLAAYGVQPHPAYLLGWGRLSCMCCIFGSANQWASIRKIAADRFNRIAAYESAFGKTIRRDVDITTLADKGTPYASLSDEYVKMAKSDVYTGEILIEPSNWTHPAGAFGENAGPS